MSQRQRYSREAEGKEFVCVGSVKRNKWIDLYPEPDPTNDKTVNRPVKLSNRMLNLHDRRPSKNEPDFRYEHSEQEIKLFKFMKDFEDNDPGMFTSNKSLEMINYIFEIISVAFTQHQVNQHMQHSLFQSDEICAIFTLVYILFI